MTHRTREKGIHLARSKTWPVQVNISRRSLLTLAAQAGPAWTAGWALRPLLSGSAGLLPAMGDIRAVARPSADQIAWQDLELGMFIHFGPQTWQDGRPENTPVPAAEIDPRRLDTDQWARTAVDLGAKYVVFVAKHQFGFCWWPTNTTDYGVRNIPWQNGHGDVVRDISDSCRRHGLRFGVYVSPRDDHFGAATGGICKTAAEQARYNRIYREQLTEVFSRYGRLVEIWFDGSTVTPVGDILQKYQPHAMIFQGPNATIRWVGNENGFAPYPCWNGIDKADAATGTATSLNSDPNGSVWMPVEADVSILRPDWFWKPVDEAKVLTLTQLLSIYYRSVGRGAQLLLNLPPDTDGLMPEGEVAAAKSFGAEIRRRFLKPVAEMEGRGASLTLKLPRPEVVDTVILQEDTRLGERVRAFALEGLTKKGWKRIGEGSAIGHKRIQPVAANTVGAVRLSVTKAVGTPAIRSFAAFAIGVAPPEDWNDSAKMWAANLIGGWKDYKFSLDITSRVQQAAQYRLRFVPFTGTVSGLVDVVLSLGGVPEPKLWSRVPARADELMLDVTGAHESSAKISGIVQGASSGQILLQRM